MSNSVTSKSLRGATELTLIAPIKPGLVPTAETLSYGSRLRRLLATLFGARKLATERDLHHVPAGGLESLRSLRFVHWTIFDNDTRLLLAVSFDGPWESYIQGIVDKAGPILDVIFCHCVNFEGHSSDLGYQKFARWVREQQIGCDFIYDADPALTTDDVRYLKEFERTHASTPAEKFDGAAARLAIGDPQLAPPDGKRYLELLTGLWRRRGEFAGAASDRRFFDRAVRMVTRRVAVEALPDQAPPFLDEWHAELTALDRVVPPGPKPVPLEAPETIQGNILSGYQGMTHGCLLFMQFASAAAGASFLAELGPRLTTEADRDRPSTGAKINVSLTYRGLRTLGCGPDELDQFPKEFREGLADRAGMLGIVGQNHPRAWGDTLPRTTAGAPIALDTIDAVVMVQTKFDGKALSEEVADDVLSRLHPLYEVVDLIGNLPGARVLGFQALRRKYEPDGRVREHFGFIDGVSQPVPSIEGRPLPPDHYPGDVVALGEILLGYPDQRGDVAAYSGTPNLLKNGSFLVMNKMAQEVEALTKYVASARLPDSFVASMVGRSKDGDPLVRPGRPTAEHNSFDYEGDADGARCPFHAHIRRANPRLKEKLPDGRVLLPPRIMRRGFAYGPRVGEGREGRGVIFMAYNASLAMQYEVIQRWVNGGNSTGSLSTRGDLLAGLCVGAADPRTPAREITVLDEQGVPQRYPPPTEPLVRLHWGLYLFTPSTAAIAGLVARATAAGTSAATRAPAATHAAGPLALQVGATPPAGDLVAAGDEEIRRIGRLRELEQRHEWKQLLESRDRAPLAKAVWAAIRARGGVFRSPIGVLAGSADAVTQVLSREDCFSVRTYWGRMSASLGETALGMDAVPRRTQKLARTAQDERYEKAVRPGRYQEEAERPNSYMSGIGFGPALASARAMTERLLAALAESAAQAAKEDKETVTRVPVDIAELGGRVLAELTRLWFGLPAAMEKTAEPAMKDRGAGRCPIDFALASQFIFRPDPGLPVTALAQERGALVKKAAALQVHGPAADEGPYLKYLRAQGHGGADASVAEAALERAWITAVNGFVAPTYPHFTNLMTDWIQSKELWRLQQWLRRPESDGGPPHALLDGEPKAEELSQSLLMQALKRTMRKDPVPDLLYREAIVNLDVSGKRGDGQPADRVAIDAGELVIVGLASAASDQPEGDVDLLFGGKRKEGSPLYHACPGQNMALGVLAGIVVGLMKQPDLRERGRLVLDIEVPLTDALPAPPAARKAGGCPMGHGAGPTGNGHAPADAPASQLAQPKLDVRDDPGHAPRA